MSELSPEEVSEPQLVAHSAANDQLLKYLLEDTAKRHQYQHEFSVEGFKTLILLNGGAIISLLTYLGHNTAKNVGGQLSTAFIWYVVGLVAVVLAYLAAYMSQGSFLETMGNHAWRAMNLPADDPEPHAKRGLLAIAAGVLLCVISLAAFVAGSWCALSALT